MAKVDFFRVTTPKPGMSSILQSVAQMPAMSVPVGQDYAYVFGLEKFLERWRGSIVRVRMNELPRTSDLNGQLGDLPIRDDQGLAEETLFVYDPSYRCLVLTRTRGGYTATGWARYFEEACHLPPIELEAVLVPDIQAQLNAIGNIRTILFSAAKPTKGSPFAGESIDHVLDAFDDLGASKFTVTIGTAGRKKSDGLERFNVLKYVKELLARGHSEGDIEKLVLSGRSIDDERSMVVDLLNNRIRDDMDLPADGRYMSRELALVGLDDIYMQHRHEISSQFKEEA